MTPVIIYSIVSVSALGLIAAVILYVVAQKFKVYEDPRIDTVEDILPNANCGACGFPGCRNFAEAIVNSDDISAFYCPVGGNDTMKEVAKVLGKEAVEQDPKVAVLKCNGTFAHRPRTNEYDGPATCAIQHNTHGGDTDCAYGCLGHGDCVDVCDFDALYMNPETGLPEVVDENCTACGACVEACPRDLFELRRRARKGRKVYVSCINQDPGATPKKACTSACISCGLCVKECPFDAITMENNIAYIHDDKCTLCRKCVPVCPTGAILEIGFPPPKPKRDKKKPKAKVGEKDADKAAAPAKGASKPAAGAEKTAQKDRPSEETKKKPEKGDIDKPGEDKPSPDNKN